MDFVADLHLHSKYSRAVSKDMVLPTIAKLAKEKGIDIVAAPDWTHPLWFKEISKQLEEVSEGLYRLKQSVIPNSFRDPNSGSDKMLKQVQHDRERNILFLLSVEIASIYSQGGKLRRIHNLVFAPNIQIAEKINKELLRRGCNLMSDGRPIIGISSRNLLEMLLNIDRRILLIPAHIWTPHFGIYGSASGFDSLDEAFGELSEYIYGIETGLSSDPEMNWQMRELNGRSILSFSDAHSPAKMGRELTVFQLTQPTYEHVRKAIMYPSRKSTDYSPQSPEDSQSTNKVKYTIEFYPEEGKYHFSGHRKCKVIFGPEEIRTKGDTCPICKKRLTEGVLYRVQQLSNKHLLGRVQEKTSASTIKWFTDTMKIHPPYVKLIPLHEIVAESMESTVASQKVKIAYASLIQKVGSEAYILLKAPLADIRKHAGGMVADGVERVRKGGIVIDPGYDGVYGKVKIWNEQVKAHTKKTVEKQAQEDEKQTSLF